MSLHSIAGIVSLLACLPPAVAAQDPEEQQFRSLLEKSTPSIVMVNLVVKMEVSSGGQSQDQESRTTTGGTLVDASGLVMLSSTSYGAKPLEKMFKSFGGSADVKATPTDFKVILDRDAKEYKAFLVATDDKLNLAFIQIEELGGRKLPAVDFSKAASPAVGQKLAYVSRLEKGYDYAALCKSGRVSGRIETPREAWIFEGAASDIGLPVYTMSGDLVGVLASILSEIEDEGESAKMGMGMLLSMMGQGGKPAAPLFILPGKTIQNRIEQARKQAAELIAERAKKGEEKRDK